MSGHQVPYQLRTNKFVERQLFLDVLDFIRVWNGPSQYVYASMGGPFLEDFKQVNDRLAIEHMVSLEADATTWSRQQFNVPYGFIECRNETTGAFITGYDKFISQYTDHRAIIWLDYADSTKRCEQLQEYGALVVKLGDGDVIKITLNANPQTVLKRSDHRSLKEPQFERLWIGEAGDELGEYIPAGGVVRNNIVEKGFAELLTRCVEMAAMKATEHSELTPVPLIATRYKDGEHQMLTVTAIMCAESLLETIANDALFGKWPFRSPNWRDVSEVNVPHLSAKERMAINYLLSRENNVHEIHQQIGVQFEDTFGASMDLLRSYLKHYRRYPAFGRVQ